ncbi:hypothetical protein GOP47_0029026 [Adiantum capillus-veneris]|nr:hypothetical protein GOP47_0029026 [Adiantum capillus-veneris]
MGEAGSEAKERRRRGQLVLVASMSASLEEGIGGCLHAEKGEGSHDQREGYRCKDRHLVAHGLHTRARGAVGGYLKKPREASWGQEYINERGVEYGITERKD